eukprot:SAG22_NODE_21065_length_260_cov_0.757764_1_plen_51_part_01
MNKDGQLTKREFLAGMAAWRPEQQKAQVRRQERHDMQESTYVERTVDLDMA